MVLPRKTKQLTLFIGHLFYIRIHSLSILLFTFFIYCKSFSKTLAPQCMTPQAASENIVRVRADLQKESSEYSNRGQQRTSIF